jgi:hypothetical protein
MNRILISMAAVALMAAFSTAAQSTFDLDDEGWTITGDAQGGGVLPTWESSGGNPGGYISATDNVQGGTWYFNAPDAFHGDFSSAYGTNLTFDLRQSRITSQFDNVDVYLRGAGMDLTFDTAGNPGTDWTGYSLLLTEAGGWDLGGLAPTQTEFQQVLADVTDLQIRGEYVSGADVGDLDNVVFVPEPATMVLLGIGGLAVLRRSRR